jgi:cell division protein FtsL
MRKHTEHWYQKVGRLLVTALAGQASTAATVFVYASIAVLLLAYVSAQVLTGVLTQEIAALSSERSRQSETMNKLAAEYVALSSRARVTRFCEEKLGMAEASGTTFRRIAVSGREGDAQQPVEFTRRVDPVADSYRFSVLIGENGKSDG